MLDHYQLKMYALYQLFAFQDPDLFQNVLVAAPICSLPSQKSKTVSVVRLWLAVSSADGPP